MGHRDIAVLIAMEIWYIMDYNGIIVYSHGICIIHGTLIWYIIWIIMKIIYTYVLSHNIYIIWYIIWIIIIMYYIAGSIHEYLQ